MKICPVCKAKAFDDAAVCYGCLYRFDRDGPTPSDRGGGRVAEPSYAPVAAEEPPPECYRENLASLPVRAAAGDGFGRHAAPAASPPAVAAEAHWRRGADGRWWLRVDVPLPRTAL